MIKRKKKVCKNCNKECYIFSKGRCKSCAAKGYTIPKISKKRQAINKATGGEKALFELVWNTRPRVSFISGKVITEPLASIFAHVLPKKHYPKYRLYDKNIVLLTPEEHNLYDNGTEEQRQSYNADWGKLYELKSELEIRYKVNHE